jgi:hypothetical protein
MPLKHTYEFDDEGSFQDTLAGRSAGDAAIRDGWVADLRNGDRMTVQVPGMPVRALVLRERLESLLGQKLTGPDVVALPVEL